MTSGIATIRGEHNDPLVVAVTDDSDSAGRIIKALLHMKPGMTDPVEVMQSANSIYSFEGAMTGSFSAAQKRLFDIESAGVFKPEKIQDARPYVKRLLNSGYGDAAWEIDTTTREVKGYIGQRQAQEYADSGRFIPPSPRRSLRKKPAVRKAPAKPPAKRCTCRRK